MSLRDKDFKDMIYCVDKFPFEWILIILFFLSILIMKKC